MILLRMLEESSTRATRWFPSLFRKRDRRRTQAVEPGHQQDFAGGQERDLERGDGESPW